MKPNHYVHDSLGDPATCTEDHNHPSLTDAQIDAAIEGMTSEELRIAFKFLHGYTERLRGDGATRAVEIVRRRREALGGRGFSADRVFVDETDRIRRVPR